jgi:hypothetical protein
MPNLTVKEEREADYTAHSWIKEVEKRIILR